MDGHIASDRALSARGVAERLDVSETTVWRMIKSGELKAERFSKRCTRIWESELHRYRSQQNLAAA